MFLKLPLAASARPRITASVSFVQSGDLKVLAVMANDRLEAIPDVPTCKECGYEAVLGTWRGLGVPVVVRLHGDGGGGGVDHHDGLELGVGQAGVVAHGLQGGQLNGDHGDDRFNSLEDFIEYSKTNKVQVGNSGIGAIWHRRCRRRLSETGPWPAPGQER